MTMHFVIPVKERLTKGPGILNGAGSLRKLGAILQGLELGFGIRVVIADMGAAVSFGHPEIGQELRNDF